MTRPPASVVVTAEAWATAQACLDRLRPTLGLRDDVILAIDAETAAAAAGPLKQYPWVRVVTGEGGAAAMANRAAATTARDVVVFVDATAVPLGRWLDALLAPFADCDIVAAGPRLTLPAGGQTVPEAAQTWETTGKLREFARSWEQAHRGQTTNTRTLSRVCLAVRRAAFEATGGFDEDTDGDGLWARLTVAGGRLLIVHGAFVAHTDAAASRSASGRPAPEGADRRRLREVKGPLLSACMIVRDEEEDLPACLASLQGLVDEVVVYDTGSVDGTVNIAREAGAVVVKGYWDDDFARARNAALAACRGQWILHIDADEVVTGDAAALRVALEVGFRIDKVDVGIDNLDSAGEAVGFTHRASRLFRRARAQWSGRLHEQVVPRPGQRPLTLGSTDDIRLLHKGYRAEAVEAKGKLERNIRVAEADLAEGKGDRGLLLTNLGRALAAAARLDDALVRFREALEVSDEPVVRRLALRHGAETLLDTGRPEEALEWIAELRRSSSRTGMADYLEGIALANLGDPRRASACFERIDEVSDDDGFVIPVHVLQLRRALALLADQRWGDAAAELLSVVSEADHLGALWGVLTEATWRAGADAGVVARAIPDDRLTAALGQVLNAAPEAGDALAEALWGDRPGELRLLAFAVRLGPRLGVERALEWSVRLRAAGLSQHCPLLALADDAGRQTEVRLRAAGVAMGAFGDDRAREAVARLAPAVEEAAILPVISELADLAPALLPDLVVAAATDARRSLAVARALHRLGATPEAVAVLHHGLEHDAAAPDDVVLAARDWLTEVGEPALSGSPRSPVGR